VDVGESLILKNEYLMLFPTAIQCSYVYLFLFGMKLAYDLKFSQSWCKESQVYLYHIKSKHIFSLQFREYMLTSDSPHRY